ncbi:MAG: hypothetical protein PHZ02_07110 [Desulfocapsaceae bacterium]|nr:hypothetical protein [Desulfocapsaceae bacterium]
MQVKKSQMVRKVLFDLATQANVKGIKGLAVFLNETEGRLYGWIRNGNIVDTGTILTKFPGVNIDWLKTGEGPMFTETQIVSPSTSHPTLNHKITARIEPGRKTYPQKGQDKENKKTDPQQGIDQVKEDEFSETDIVNQTLAVIRSKTIYKPALLSNVRAFYQGVRREEEMEGIDKKMNKMENDMEEMKQMLLSLGATNKKRETQANS